MTPEALIALGNRVKYKPNTRLNFEYYRTTFEDSVRVSIKGATVDSRDERTPTDIVSDAIIMPEHFDDERQFLDWLFNFIMQFEKHEAQEWFKFNGVQILDPHPSVP